MNYEDGILNLVGLDRLGQILIVSLTMGIINKGNIICYSPGLVRYCCLEYPISRLTKVASYVGILKNIGPLYLSVNSILSLCLHSPSFTISSKMHDNRSLTPRSFNSYSNATFADYLTNS